MTHREVATRHHDNPELVTNELRATNVNGRTEMLPSDPKAIAGILRERRNKTAAKARSKMAASHKRRGL